MKSSISNDWARMLGYEHQSGFPFMHTFTTHSNHRRNEFFFHTQDGSCENRRHFGKGLGFYLERQEFQSYEEYIKAKEKNRKVSQQLGWRSYVA